MKKKRGQEIDEKTSTLQISECKFKRDHTVKIRMFDNTKFIKR